MEFLNCVVYYFLSYLIYLLETCVAQLKKAERVCSFQALDDQRRMIILMQQEFKRQEEEKSKQKFEEFKMNLTKEKEEKVSSILFACQRYNYRLKAKYENELEIKELEKKFYFIISDNYYDRVYRNRELELFKHYIKYGYWKYEGPSGETQKSEK